MSHRKLHANESFPTNVLLSTGYWALHTEGATIYGNEAASVRWMQQNTQPGIYFPQIEQTYSVFVGF